MKKRCRKKLTYKEWLERGRQVMKGSKHVGRNADGYCVFYKTQTKPAVRRQYPVNYSGDEEYDMDDMIWDYISDIGDR